jgi:predicted lipoprotein with Yx(FWY)xxD motif
VIGSAALAAAGLVGATAAAHASAPAASHGAKVSLRHTSKGKVLVGPNGHSLYDFSSDTKNHSNCDSTCRLYWHPLKSKHAPRAGTGVRARFLGRTSAHQVTYHGKPLYYYVADTKPGQVKGDDTLASGGYWYLVNAKGKNVT